MKTRQILRMSFVPLLIFALHGCETKPTHPAEKLVIPLTKLTTAIDGLVSYPDPTHPISDDRLAGEAMKLNPELERAFRGYPVKVQHSSKEVVVLVCSPDGKCAWLENASGTDNVDQRWFEKNPAQPAAFTIKLPNEDIKASGK